MSDRDAFRAAQQERREHGLKARHETREARAVRSDPVKALRYLLAQYDRVVEVHEHVVMDTPEDRELHDRAVATFREAAEPIRTALADSLDDLLTASEVKVLTETAGEVGRRIGWKAAGEEIAVRLEAVRDQIGDGAQRELCHDMAAIAHYVASQAAGATSDATSGVAGHPEVSEAVRSPQEPRGSHWNYRLTVRTESDDNETWEVREIYYNDAGEISLWSKDAVAALGDSWEECAADLSRMAEASDHAAFDLDAKQWVDHQRRPKDPS